jgi:peptidoglycan/LPS O-acetylase OafA/YrhL
MAPRLPQPSLDWMKAIGIAVIVYGHVAHATTVPLTPPVYLKQFGVTLFVFVTGFTLARERRPGAAVVLARLFPIYLYGCLLAAIVAIAGASTGAGLELSNVLPFLGGVNVLLDHFPANPSTWYVGTYLHLLLVWALLLRGRQVQWWMIAAALAVEVSARALLMAFVGPYVAYMSLTSWLTVFLLGMRQGARGEAARPSSPLPYLALLLGAIGVWAQLVWAMGLIPTFPFMTVAGIGAVGDAVLVSVGASALYAGVTLLVFEVVRRLPSLHVVRFAARNSLIVFLAHMPIFFALNPVLGEAGVSYRARVVILLAICGPVLAIVSEIISRMVPADMLRARLLARLGGNGLPATVGAAAAPLLTRGSTS